MYKKTIKYVDPRMLTLRCRWQVKISNAWLPIILAECWDANYTNLVGERIRFRLLRPLLKFPRSFGKEELGSLVSRDAWEGEGACRGVSNSGILSKEDGALGVLL